MEKRHAGMYQCMAQNELGSSFEFSTLRVEPTQVTAKSPNMKGFPEDSYVHGGEVNTVIRPHTGGKHKKLNKSRSEFTSELAIKPNAFPRSFRLK